MKPIMTYDEFIDKLKEQHKSTDGMGKNETLYQMGKNIMVEGIIAILRSKTIDFGNETKKEYHCVSTRYEPEEVTNKSIIEVYCYPNKKIYMKDWCFNESQTGVWGTYNKKRIFIPFANVKMVKVVKQNDD